MNKKQKEAMIAMEIKVAGLEEAVRLKCTEIENLKIFTRSCNNRMGIQDENIEALDEDVRDLWCSQKAVVDEAIRRDVAVETLQQQVKEHDARLTYLLDTMVEMNKVLKVKPIWEKHETRIAALEDWHKNHTETHMFLNKKNGELARNIETLQQQVKEINTDRNERKITALENGMDKYVLLQVIERLENLEKRPKRTVLKTASGSRWGTNTAIATAITHPPDTPQVNLLTKKTAEKARKEYKKIMKKGASVG